MNGDLAKRLKAITEKTASGALRARGWCFFGWTTGGKDRSINGLYWVHLRGALTLPKSRFWSWTPALLKAVDEFARVHGLTRGQAIDELSAPPAKREEGPWRRLP